MNNILDKDKFSKRASRYIQLTGQVGGLLAKLGANKYLGVDINKDKVAITGWSLGGGVTLFSAWLPLKNAINTELNFAALLAYFPLLRVGVHLRWYHIGQPNVLLNHKQL